MYRNVSGEVFLKVMFGMNDDEFGETVIVTPIWSLDKFAALADEVISEGEEWYRWLTVKYKGKTISIVGSKIGAPLTGDCVLALGHSKNIGQIIFSGSFGAIDETFQISDYLVGAESIIGEGFSRYHRGFEKDCFGEIATGDFELQKKAVVELKEILQNSKKDRRDKIPQVYTGRIFSTDSILGESLELIEYLRKKCCVGLEMESSAVFTAAEKIAKSAISVLIVSDVPVNKKNLFEGLDNQSTVRYLEEKRRIVKVLLELAARLQS